MTVIHMGIAITGIEAAARAAGAKIMEIYETDFEARAKDDASPVTDADEAAEAIILKALAELHPDIPVVAEESAAAGNIPDVGTGSFWLVDPLDGTKEFLKRNGEFTVNIALIEDRAPVMGVVYLPAKDTLYSGIVGHGAMKQVGDGDKVAIGVRPPPMEGLTVVGSRSHGDPAEMEKFLDGRKVADIKSAGSSLKFCLVAEGEADVYPRLGRTMEWDVAAGHAVLAAAGGMVTTADGGPFGYAKNAVFENPHFVAWGGLRPYVMRVYLAGPDVFHADAARLGMRKKAICSKYGLTGVYPLDNDLSFDGLSPFEQGIAIFQANADLMRGCDAAIANMTPFRGPSCDPGTAYEVGFMSGLGKPLAAYTNDPRPFTDRSTGMDTLTVERFGMVDNLMLDGAVHENGLEIIIHDGTDPFLDLDGFDLCCRRLADRLG